MNQFGLLQTYNLEQQFFHRYGERGKEAAFDVMRHLHTRGVFVPVKLESLINKERERLMESLMFWLKRVINESRQEPVQMEVYSVHL
jgi:hypothetical protein